MRDRQVERDREPGLAGVWTSSGLVPALVIGVVLAGACGDTAVDRDTALGTAAAGSEPIPEARDQNATELGLAGYAKVLCSAVFVSGREEAEAIEHSRRVAVGILLLPEADAAEITETVIDREEQLVRITLRNSLTRTAQYYGGQGCVIHPSGADGVFFTPVPVESRLPDPTTQSWPMGDVLPDEPLPAEVDEARLKEAVDLAFSDPEALTAAFLVAYKGRIIAERYAPGITKDTQLESWSMGKSLTAALIGVLIQDGEFGLPDPAPVPEWQTSDDQRSKIRIADLLRMSSGLQFTSGADAEGYPDHLYIYTGAIDAFRYSITRPLEFAPNTVGRYRNCDPLTLGYIMKRTVTARGEEYLTFPQRALFDRIGIRRQVLETDPYGNFLLTGYDYGTARNWARLGLLFLQDGMWEGKRILPEGFVEFVSSPAPAWEEPIYGGLFWLNRKWRAPGFASMRSLPPDAFYMAGGGVQRTLIVPSHNLVVVRLAHRGGSNYPGMEAALESGLEGIIAAIGETQVSELRRLTTVSSSPSRRGTAAAVGIPLAVSAVSGCVPV